MINIGFIEKIILPTINFLIFFGVFVVIILMLVRFRLLSIYQARILNIINPEEAKESHEFLTTIKHFYEQFIEHVYKMFVQLHLIGGTKTKEVSQKLAAAGWRNKHATTLYVLFRITVITVLALCFLWVNNAMMARYFSMNYPIISTLIGILIGFNITAILINMYIQRYRNNIRRALPDSLELMLICFEAGYSNEASLEKIASDFADYYPELAQEFFITANELRVLPDRKAAWKNFAKRTELFEINSVITALQQNDKYGTPLANSLKTQIDILRRNRIMNAEKKAGRIPVLLAIPLTICFIPILFIIILTPAIIRTMQLFYS